MMKAMKLCFSSVKKKRKMQLDLVCGEPSAVGGSCTAGSVFESQARDRTKTGSEVISMPSVHLCCQVGHVISQDEDTSGNLVRCHVRLELCRRVGLPPSASFLSCLSFLFAPGLLLILFPQVHVPASPPTMQSYTQCGQV